MKKRKKLKLLGDDLTLEQQRELQEVLSNFQDVMRDEPVLMMNMVHEYILVSQLLVGLYHTVFV